MVEKRFSIKEGSSIGLSSIYTDNGKVMTQLEVLDVLIKQHGTIQVLKASNGEMEDYLARLEEENKQLKRDNKEYIRGLDLSKTTSQSWASDVRELREQNCQLEKENTHLKQRITKLEKEVKELSDGEADWLIEEML